MKTTRFILEATFGPEQRFCFLPTHAAGQPYRHASALEKYPSSGEGNRGLSETRSGSRLISRRAVLRRRGFTLIELLLVLVILGTLAAIVVPKFAGRTEQAKITAASTQIRTFKTALNAFEVDNGYYPKGNNGLEELIEAPRDAQNWRGPYLEIQEIPVDPWGNPYVYECPGRMNPSSFDISSIGPDARAGTEDDIVSWTANR